MSVLIHGCQEQAVSPSEQSLPHPLSGLDMMAFSSQKSLSRLNCEEIDNAIERTAASLAIALNDVEIRRLVKSEAAKEFDGDTEVLFSALSAKRFSDGSTFLQKLGRSYAMAMRRSNCQISDEAGATEFAAQIEKVPLFQIGVPYYIIDKWDSETQVPLVVCLPGGVDKGAKKASRFKAYRSSGEVVWIDMRQFIKNPYPVVVLGINERTNPDGSLKTHIIPLEKTSTGFSMKGEQRINIVDPRINSVPSSTWTLVLSTLYIRWAAIELSTNWDWFSRPDMRCDVNPSTSGFRRTDIQWMFTSSENFFRSLPNDNLRYAYTDAWPGVNIPVFYTTTGRTLVNLDIVDEDWTQLWFFPDPDDLVEHRWRRGGLSNIDNLDFPVGYAGLVAAGDPYYYEGQEYRVGIAAYWIPPY